jgi:hypothetical protein
MQRQYTYTSLQQCISCFFSIPFRPSKNKNTENSLCCFAANGGGGSGACAWLLSRLGAGLHRPSALPHRERFLLITITTIQLRSPPGSAAAPLFHRRPLSAILFLLPSTPRREDQCALLVTILNSVESGFVHHRRHNSTPSTIGVACSSLSSS